MILELPHILIQILFFLYSFRSAICDLPVTEQEFVEQLHELSHKINVVKQQSYKGAMACNDVKDVLDKLRSKVRIFASQYVFAWWWLSLLTDSV